MIPKTTAASTQFSRRLAVGLAATPLLYGVWGNARYTLRPVLLPFQPLNESWLPTGEDRSEKWHALAGRIVSRLGERSLGHVDPGAASAVIVIAALRDGLARHLTEARS